MSRRASALRAVAAAGAVLLAGFAFARALAARRAADERRLAVETAAEAAADVSARLAELARLADAGAAAGQRPGRLQHQTAPADGEGAHLLLVGPRGELLGGCRHWRPGEAEELAGALGGRGHRPDRGPVLLGPFEVASGREFVVAARVGEGGGVHAAALETGGLLPPGEIRRLTAAGYLVELSATEPLTGGERLLLRSSVLGAEEPVRLRRAERSLVWTLGLAPAAGWTRARELRVQLGGAGILCLLTGFWTYELCRRRARLDERVRWTEAELREAKRRAVDEEERRLQVEDRALLSSFHDPVTRLPNRAEFVRRLQRGLERLRRGRSRGLAVALVGLERFRQVNQTLGYAAGNQLLTEAARRLEDGVRPHDLVARVEGDLFAVLLYDVEDAALAVDLGERLREALGAPFELSGQRVFVSANEGISFARTGYERPEELYRQAVAALHQAKAEPSGSRVLVFHPALGIEAQDSLLLDSRLREGLANDELVPYFQPIVDLSTGLLAGAESLIRWRHPVDGLIPPYRFIHLAEETGFITEISRFVIRKVCRQAAAWARAFPGLPGFYLTINLSGREVSEPRLCREIEEVLSEAEVEEGRVKIEVTERVIMRDAEGAHRVLEELHAMGLPLLLDDFGTGYCSLNYLQRFPFQGLKIDRGFVHDIGRRQRERRIVESVVHLARGLGMITVAEGIETAAQARALRDMGCDYGQGFYFARPQPKEQFEKLLASNAPFRIEARAAPVAAAGGIR